jgi:peptide/nickel transport system permease protein
MLNSGRSYIATAWWMTVFPGLAIVATAGALTTIGRRLASPEQLRRSRREVSRERVGTA